MCFAKHKNYCVVSVLHINISLKTKRSLNMSRIVSPKHVFCTQKDQDVHKSCHHKCVLKKQPIIESCYLITMNMNTCTVFYCCSLFSVPKWRKKIGQPTRSFFSSKISWKSKWNLKVVNLFQSKCINKCVTDCDFETSRELLQLVNIVFPGVLL